MKPAGNELPAFQSVSPPTTSDGFRMSSTAAASPRGNRHDSEVGVAPHFQTANVVSKNSLLFGKPIATRSPGLTPLAAKARARRLALRSNCHQVSVSAPWLIAMVSSGLRSANQRGTSAIGICMRAFPGWRLNALLCVALSPRDAQFTKGSNGKSRLRPERISATRIAMLP
jgi:hypothetical protein